MKIEEDMEYPTGLLFGLSTNPGASHFQNSLGKQWLAQTMGYPVFNLCHTRLHLLGE